MRLAWRALNSLSMAAYQCGLRSAVRTDEDRGEIVAADEDAVVEVEVSHECIAWIWLVDASSSSSEHWVHRLWRR